MAQRKPGRSFGRLWVAITASTVGTWLGFGAFPLLPATPFLLHRRSNNRRPPAAEPKAPELTTTR